MSFSWIAARHWRVDREDLVPATGVVRSTLDGMIDYPFPDVALAPVLAASAVRTTLDEERDFPCADAVDGEAGFPFAVEHSVLALVAGGRHSTSDGVKVFPFADAPLVRCKDSFCGAALGVAFPLLGLLLDVRGIVW